MSGGLVFGDTMDASAPISLTARSTDAAYRALRDGAALVDRTLSGRIRYSGADSLDLISRLSTNELLSLEVGQGAATVLTTPKGRIVDVLIVSRREDSLLVLTSYESRGKVLGHVDFFTFGEDAAASDITDRTVSYAVAGPKAPELMASMTGLDLERYSSAAVAFGSVKASVVRTDFLGLPAYDLIAPASSGADLRDELLSRSGGALMPAGPEAVETVRIERGEPAYGAELGESYNPLEANLRGMVSFTKGCYVGQEVVTRLDTYKKVQKRLVGLKWTAGSRPASGARLLAEGRQVGVVTSATRPAADGGGIALGYVRTAHARPGAALSMETDGGEVEARVTGLPFSA